MFLPAKPTDDEEGVFRGFLVNKGFFCNMENATSLEPVVWVVSA